MEEHNVSVEKIEDGIRYLEEDFMRPIVDMGELLIEDYKKLKGGLNDDGTIDQLILNQETALNEIKNEITAICNKARESMEDSNTVIKNNQETIIDEGINSI